jgi:hypothetical protein
MRRSTRALAALAVAAVVAGVVACGSSPTGPQKVSLAGNYNLTGFTEGTTDLSGLSSGTLVLTDSAYAVDIAFAGGIEPEIVDSGTYVATDSGSFSETSRLNGLQISGTYTFVNNLLTVMATEQGIAVSQAWQKH